MIDYKSLSEQRVVSQPLLMMKGAVALPLLTAISGRRCIQARAQGLDEYQVKAALLFNFILEANRVGFEINAGMAEQARLKVSSRLPALAKTVRN